MPGLAEGGVRGLGLDHVRAGDAPGLGRVVAIGEDRVQDAPRSPGGDQPARVVSRGRCGFAVVQPQGHGDDLGLELGGAGAHVALEDVHVGEEAERLVHEVIVVVITAVHGSRALARLPERVLLDRHGAQLGQDLLAGQAHLRQVPMDLEPVGVGVGAH